jgi:AcrR family transcriptional regulator
LERSAKDRHRSSRRRKELPRQRYDEILDIAARVFADKGYEATSMQDIADAVGLLKGSLYYYITSKEDLLFGVVQHVHERFMTVAGTTAKQQGDASERLRTFLEEYIRFYLANLVKITVFLHDFRSLDVKDRGGPGSPRQDCSRPDS